MPARHVVIALAMSALLALAPAACADDTAEEGLPPSTTEPSTTETWTRSSEDGAPLSTTETRSWFLSIPLTPELPDPVVVAHDGEFYVYGTNLSLGATLNVPMYRTPDLMQSICCDDALPRLPDWAAPGSTWAPGVIRAVTGEWVLYYSALERATGLVCIGRAIAPTPAGPFVDDSGAPLICQRELGGSIDPSPYADDGTLWLYWKNDGNAVQPAVDTWIYTIQLSPDGRQTVGLEPVRLLAADRRWEASLIESPFMHRDEFDRLWLFYSGNRWDTRHYGIGVAQCLAPTGPCAKRSLDGPWFGSDDTVWGPGGPSVFDDGAGATYLVYHGWEPELVGYPAGTRSPRLARLTFDADGPVAER